MAEKFDSKAVAKKVEEHGYELLHNKNSRADLALAEELRGLTREQLKAVNEQIKSDNHFPNTLPRVEMQLDEKGNLNSISFTQATLDFTAERKWVSVGAPKQGPLEDDQPVQKPSRRSQLR